MVFGSDKKKRPCNQVKDSHGKTILAQNIWFSLSFFLRRQIWFWPVQCWFIHRSVLFCHLENTAIPLPKKSFFEWMCFLHLSLFKIFSTICSDRKCSVYIFIMDRPSNIQTICSDRKCGVYISIMVRPSVHAFSQIFPWCKYSNWPPTLHPFSPKSFICISN